ncbi:sigma-54-dependent Fis family transcriptional regulator, partial [Citrobacter sp. AAK_AS5]
WPGNVRELENALEYAVALGRGQTVQVEDLPPEIRSPDFRDRGAAGARAERAESTRRVPPASSEPPDPEEAPIRAALERNLWNRS